MLPQQQQQTATTVTAVSSTGNKEAAAAGEEEPKNPVEELYDKAFQAGFGRWVCGIIAMGLAAGVLSKGPPKPQMIICAFNIAVGASHFFLFGPTTHPISRTNPKPPKWYIVVLAISTVFWLAAFVGLFALVGDDYDDDYYEVYDPGSDKLRLKRAGWGSLIKDFGMATMDGLQDIYLACGAFGGAAFICCLYQAWAVYKLHKGGFTEEEILEGWEKMKPKEEEKKKEKKKNKTPVDPSSVWTPGGTAQNGPQSA